MEKKETKKCTRELTELDRKYKQATASARAERIYICPKKEDVDMRLTTTIRVRNWQRLPPGRHLVNNLAKSRACNERVTHKKVKPPKGDNQATKAEEWRKLKIVFRKTTIPEVSNHRSYTSTNAEKLAGTSRRRTQTNKDQEEELVPMTWEPQSPSQ
ncbi:unnamed protein product [Lactuca virosa]|uniref:Uncharacterized protein n=1 Tax=Lactuca virosa TaxID=75947 RepID=A0AAU9NQL4_9ASTR|nr:unnamed protein product [Lactuca virosa]